jgi:hypothetical protein
MTLESILRQQLNDPEPGGFHVQADGWNVTVAAGKKDSLSCALNALTLEKAGPIAADLRTWATRVAERATGLLEPLRLIEADVPQGKAILRSATPAQRDGKAHYYELLLTRTDNRASAALHRFAGQLGERREAQPFVLTHDAIIKLAQDIVG